MDENFDGERIGELYEDLAGKASEVHAEDIQFVADASNGMYGNAGEAQKEISSSSYSASNPNCSRSSSRSPRFTGVGQAQDYI